MNLPSFFRLLDPADPGWPRRIEEVRALLGAPVNPALFPAHFLQAVLPRIGGKLLLAERAQETIAAGFLFPRALGDGRRWYTLRAHAIAPGVSLAELAGAAETLLPGARVVPYDPTGEHTFRRSSVASQGLEVGAPSAEEAETLRALQARVWGRGADDLYPADLYSPDFGSAQSVIARRADKVVGFLFGFYKFGGRPLPLAWQDQVDGNWRLESQVLAVDPDLRGHGIATVLKAQQAEMARRAGIAIVNWTVDPLLWPNAVLNFGRLGALAFDFVPDMYPLRDELNRVSASRLALTWLVRSQRVRDRLRNRGEAPELAGSGAVAVNTGAEHVDLDVDAPVIAVEIPLDWTALQREALDEALAWRQTTDALLSRYVGSEPGRYAVAGVAQKGGRRFLLAERVTNEWLRAVAG